jgi:ribosomal protein S18 acetylase RimI-like enzyme
MATELELRDGTRAMTWSLLKEDRQSLADAYAQLRPDSQYHRFLSAVPRLTEPMLQRLVDDVDGIDHVALVMFVFDEDHVANGAAIGRMIRYDDDPETADLAVTVEERYRGRGVASCLVEQLSRQRPKGVKRILTEVAADNAASIAMLRRLGPTTLTPVGGNVLEARVELAPAEEGADPSEAELAAAQDG